MLNIGVSFKILDTGKTPPPGYSKSSGPMIYLVKMDFTRKKMGKGWTPYSRSWNLKLCRSCFKGKLSNTSNPCGSTGCTIYVSWCLQCIPTLSVVLNSILKILGKNPSSQEPYMGENVLEKTSSTILEDAWSSLALSLPVLIKMCGCENTYERMELLNTMSMYCWENTGGIQKGVPSSSAPQNGAPPSSAPQNQTSTSTWNPTSYTWWYA